MLAPNFTLEPVQAPGVQFRARPCRSLEVRMLNRLVFLLVFLLAVPAVSQHSTMQSQINRSVEQRQQQISQVSAAPEPDTKAVRLQALIHDANELSALSASVQSDLRQLQSGLLVKDLHDHLKKMEKLSKRLRQEME
jgi:hypothetical protein